MSEIARKRHRWEKRQPAFYPDWTFSYNYMKRKSQASSSTGHHKIENGGDGGRGKKGKPKKDHLIKETEIS